jgi:phage terminase large subunit-like protein
MPVDIITRKRARLIKNTKLARTCFRTFVETVWANEPGFDLAKFHLKAIDAYTKFDEKFMYWEAARGHGKSLITMAFCVWCLGRDTNLKIKLICANDKEARKRLYEIKEQIKKNALLHIVFPKLVPDPDGEWNKSRIFVKRGIVSKDPSIEAMGVMSGSLGSRANIIIFDDIVDMRNAVLQPQLREHVRQKVFGEIVPLLEPDFGIIRAVGTPWTLVDVNAIMKESEGWYQVGPDRVGEEDGKLVSIWPYKFSVADLKQLLLILGPAEFARAYRCCALTADTVPIQGQWIKFYDANVLGDPYTKFCLQPYDLAIGQNAEHDYFGWASMLWDRERNYVFIADAGHERLTFNSQANKVISNARSWHPQEIVIEHGGYQGALSSYLEEDAKRMLPIWPFRNRGRSKERRMVEASPWFEKGRVFFHPKLDPRRNPDVHLKGDPIGELTSFPFGKHDDISDAIAMGLLTITEMDPNAALEEIEEEGFDAYDGFDGIACRVTAI